MPLDKSFSLHYDKQDYSLKGSVILRISLRACLECLLGSAILSFGLYNIHAFSGVTEGGLLGLTLLLHHWLHISPSISGFVLNFLCYFIGWKTLGRMFLFYSAVAGGGFSMFYAIFEQFPPVWPGIAAHPLPAAVVGAVFVGVGVGFSIRAGGAPGGDDALGMALSKLLRQPIERIYLAMDIVVLLLSLSYLPVKNISCSLLSVLLSGRIVGIVSRIPRRAARK